MAVSRSVLVYLFVIFVARSIASQTKYVDISTVIQNHFAETTLTSDILNDANYSKEIGFQVMLPKEAFITHFEMTIDHVTYEGVIEEKVKAKKLFTEAKKKGKTAGLVETREQADKIFKTSVNVGSGTLVQFKLIYQQLLRKIRGKFSSKVILFGDQLSEFLTMNIYICESRRLKNVTVPAILTGDGRRVQPTVAIDVFGKSAHVEFLNDNDDIMSSIASAGGGFIVEYELESSQDAADVVVNDGYFIYFGPDIEFPPRRIYFVLDVSGSMSGLKLQQMKKAMLNILTKMAPTDRIGVMKFASRYETWIPGLHQATSDNIVSAKYYVDHDQFSGGTEIWLAMERALRFMNEDIVDGEKIDPRNNFILLLTDGEGSLSGEQLAANVRNANNAFGIHTVSFGEYANDASLKTIAAQNNGTWKKILVDLDSALQIENYVDELGVSSSGLVIEYPDVIAETMSVDSKYGGEIMTVGRLDKAIGPRNRGPHEVSIQGFSEGNMIVRSQFYTDQNTVSECGGMGGHEIKKFAEKAFGMTKVEKALAEYENSRDPTQKEVFKQKAINISLSYKLVTPVTSLLVIKPEDEADIKDAKKNATNGEDLEVDEENGNIRKKKKKKGKLSSALKIVPTKPPQWSLHSDPHFVARLSNDITVCFNWVGRNREIVNLFSDERNSIVINSLIEGEGKSMDGPFTKHLFVTKLAILLGKEDLAILIDPDIVTAQVLSNGRAGEKEPVLQLRDIESFTASLGDLLFEIKEVKRHHVILSLTIRKTISIVVEVHHRTIENNKSCDHLDLAMPAYEDSSETGGLFGHLQRKNYLAGEGTRIILDRTRNKTFLLYNNDKILVKKWRMKIPYLKTEIDCWLAKSHFQHLLGQKLQHFKLANIMDDPGIL